MRHLNSATMTAVRLYYKGICQYCGASNARHVDHIMPLSKGGADALENVTLACAGCNLRKSAIKLDPMFLAIAHARARDAAPKILKKVTGVESEGNLIRAKTVGEMGHSARQIANALHTIEAAGFDVVIEELALDSRENPEIFQAAKLVRGMVRAWRRDKYGPDRKNKLSDEQVSEAIRMLDDPTITSQEVADHLKVSRATVYREVQMKERKERMKEIKALEAKERKQQDDN